MLAFGSSIRTALLHLGELSGDYTGTDAGYLVTSIAAASGTSHDGYAFRIRATKGRAEGRIYWGQGNMFDVRRVDFEDKSEKGIVDIRRLPPGDYEVFNFIDTIGIGAFQIVSTSPQDFSIPFSIVPGQATYLGEFLAVSFFGKGAFGEKRQVGAVFVVADKEDRDLAIARRKEPSVGKVFNAVVNADALDNPFLRSHLPE